MFRIAQINAENDFFNLKSEWDQLLSVSNSNNIFLTWEWLYNWWDVFGDNNRLIVLEIRKDDNSELKGLAPLYITKEQLFGPKKLKVMQFLGTGIVCSDYLDIISARGFEQDVIKCLIEYLYENRQLFDYLKFDDLPQNSRTIPLLRKHASHIGFSFETQRKTVCPYLPLSQNWNECTQNLSVRMKKNLAYYQRRLEKEFAVTFESIDSQSDPCVALDHLLKLHQIRWKSKGEPGLFSSKKFEMFHRNIIKTFSDKGWLRLFFLKLNEGYAASIYGFSYNDKYYYYQAGFDERYKKYSIGQVLLNYYVRKAFEEKIKEFDFLRGVGQYKYLWTNQERYNYSFFIGKRDLAEKLFFLRYKLARTGKDALKSILPAKIKSRIRFYKAKRKLGD